MYIHAYAHWVTAMNLFIYLITTRYSVFCLAAKPSVLYKYNIYNLLYEQTSLSKLISLINNIIIVIIIIIVPPIIVGAWSMEVYSAMAAT